MTRRDLDAVPTAEITVGSFEESQRWLTYSMCVLVPRSAALRARTARLSVPWRYLAWRRSIREWRALTARMEAILAANVRWVASASEPAAMMTR